MNLEAGRVKAPLGSSTDQLNYGSKPLLRFRHRRLGALVYCGSFLRRKPEHVCSSHFGDKSETCGQQCLSFRQLHMNLLQMLVFPRGMVSPQLPMVKSRGFARWGSRCDWLDRVVQRPEEKEMRP